MVTNRAVLYVGYQCNARCVHCYFKHKTETAWRPLEEVKADALRFREVYGNDHVDITGGEPSIYPHIVELIRYCREIGLVPTIITNGTVLATRLQEFLDAGLEDVLLSVHSNELLADEIYGFKGIWGRLTAAIDALNAKNVFWRSNTCMLWQNYHALPEIARFLADKGVKIANFIAFNPYHEWQQMQDIDCQVRHEVVEPYLRKAIGILTAADTEINVRYFPWCHLKGLEWTQSNWLQLPNDRYEWDMRSWLDPWYHWKSDATIYSMASDVSEKMCSKAGPCERCRHGYQVACDGLAKQYSQRFGFDQCQPYGDKLPKQLLFDVIGYYTRNTGYEELAKRLQASLDLFNIEHHIIGVRNLGSWQRNTQFKPEFIKWQLRSRRRPVLYVDVDAVLHRYPSQIHNLIADSVDFAVHYFKHNAGMPQGQLASGTLFFNYTEAAFELLDAWIDRCAQNPDMLDQLVLQELLDGRTMIDTERTRMRVLPESYCKIFDLTPGCPRPVIEHHQASRTLRQAVERG
jgi:pyruvate-formate lyase-activating enzyme